MTWSSVLCRLESRLSRFLIAAVPLMHALDATLHKVYELTRWSFEAMLSGVFPDRDPEGNPWPAGSWRAARAGTRIAGPFRAVLAQVLGDWKWLKEAFKLKYGYDRIPVCHLCQAAKRGVHRFDDFNLKASHRSTRRTLGEY